ncbi:MAG: hypothetical protein JO301_03785 [Chitinophagaceae bacterium]|nr:hypothetical protein [Chitinophagaceae bacterium]
MKTATVHELKQELQESSHARLLELCLRLARFKKENKELLTYLLFEAHNEEGYITSVKLIIDEGFDTLPKSGAYLQKKSLRKTLRITNKYIRYTGSRQAEAALLLYFCSRLRSAGIDLEKSTVLMNLYLQQLKKIDAAIATLHEDLQYDFRKELEALQPVEAKSKSPFLKLFRKR